MVKLYAQMGRHEMIDKQYVIYFCGTYFVLVDVGTVYQVIADYFCGRIRDKKEAVDVTGITSKIIRCCDDSYEEKTRSEMIDDLESSGFLAVGEGLTHPEAVLHLFEECAFELKYPVPSKAPFDFTYARNPITLSAAEKKIYKMLEKQYKKIKDIPYEEIHGKDYQKYYITLRDIMKEMQKTGKMKPLEVVQTLESLYEKHCIALFPKEPKYEYIDGDKLHMMYPAAMEESV